MHFNYLITSYKVKMYIVSAQISHAFVCYTSRELEQRQLFQSAMQQEACASALFLSMKSIGGNSLNCFQNNSNVFPKYLGLCALNSSRALSHDLGKRE